MDHDSETPFTADSLLSALRGLDRRELTFTQFVALHVIAGRGRPTIREVADAIDRSPAATSHLLEDLVRAGLVARAPSSEDRRVKRVHVTAAAKEYLAALHKAHHERPQRRHPH